MFAVRNVARRSMNRLTKSAHFSPPPPFPPLCALSVFSTSSTLPPTTTSSSSPFTPPPNLSRKHSSTTNAATTDSNTSSSGSATKKSSETQSLDDTVEVVDTNLFPEGLPPPLTKELKQFNNEEISSWVIRSLTLEIQHRLENFIDGDKEALTDGVAILAGPRELGKSVVLCQVVQWARSNGWIVLYSPSSGRLLRKGIQIYPSRHTEGKFDQPDLAGPMLHNLRKAHGKQLNRLKLKGEPRPMYVAERQRKEEKRAKKRTSSGGNVECTLLDIVDHGLLNGADAATCYHDLREQLSLVDDNDNAKVLFVIDDVNTLYSDTVFGYEMKKIDASELTLSGTLQPFNANGLRQKFVPKNGALLCATTGTSNFLPSVKDVEKTAPNMFDYLVPVRPYDEGEFDAAIRLYCYNGLVPLNALRKPDEKERRSELILSDIAAAKVASSSHPGVLYEHIVENSIGHF
jgi:hypothetical protein